MNCRKDITVRKIWTDDNNRHNTRPNSVEITLLRDGKIYDTGTISAAGNWTYIFKCKPVWNNSELYEYKVDEVDIPGYSKSIKGYEITNTLTEITISGTKTWVDNHNAKNTRPASITVLLYQNGVQVNTLDLVTPAGEDTAPFSFAGAPFTDDQGKPYVYTIGERVVPGYNMALNGFNLTNTLIAGGFSFNKTSVATGLSLQGAVFEIRQNGTLVTSSTSDTAGNVSFSDLLPGTYLMAETLPPVGYMDNTDIYDVIVSADGSVTIDGLPAEEFSVTNTPEAAEIVLSRATAVVPAYMSAPNTWSLHGTTQPDLYMLDKILITLPYPAVTVKWAYGVQDAAYFRTGGGIDITSTYQNGFPAPLNTDYTVYVMFSNGTDDVTSITIDRLRDGSAEMPYLLIDFSTADTLEPSVPGIDQFTLYYMQGNGIKLTQHYEIYENIDMEGKTWEPIGLAQPIEYFTGSLYGNANEIKNLHQESTLTSYYLGLFLIVGDSASIQNLSLSDCDIESYYAGGFASYFYAINGGTILLKDLHFSGSIKAIGGGIAGFLGAANGSIIVDGCTTDGDITSIDNAGGLTGFCEAAENSSISITNCYSSGTLTSERGAASLAGIAGLIISDGAINISNCASAMTVQNAEHGGGIAGAVGGLGTAVISSCYNKGDISGRIVGGIAGQLFKDMTFELNEDIFGEIIGRITGQTVTAATPDLKIINSYNSGTVNADLYGGGIYGFTNTLAVTQNCYNTGNVIMANYYTTYAGGVSGNYGSIDSCAAINGLVSSDLQAARISPSIDDATTPVLNNNVAFDNMQVLINGVQKFPLDTGSAGTDGTSITAAVIKTQALYENTLGWDFNNTWIFGNGAYTLPVLRGIPTSLQPTVLPSHL